MAGGKGCASSDRFIAEVAGGKLKPAYVFIGDEAFFCDRPLYRAFGYVLKSERASGLTRRASESTSLPITKAA